jgi:tetrahydromethanopterin S-methyltransferase subunit G
MALPAVYSDGEKCRRIQQQISEMEKQLEQLNTDWEQAAGKLG